MKIRLEMVMVMMMAYIDIQHNQIDGKVFFLGLG